MSKVDRNKVLPKKKKSWGNLFGNNYSGVHTQDSGSEEILKVGKKWKLHLYFIPYYYIYLSQMLL